MSIKSAFSQLLTTQTDGIGKILGDAIRNSINNILAIAGFIIFFSTDQHAHRMGIMDNFALLISNWFAFLNIPYPVAYGLGIGLFENHLRG